MIIIISVDAAGNFSYTTKGTSGKKAKINKKEKLGWVLDADFDPNPPGFSVVFQDPAHPLTKTATPFATDPLSTDNDFIKRRHFAANTRPQNYPYTVILNDPSVRSDDPEIIIIDPIDNKSVLLTVLAAAGIGLIAWALTKLPQAAKEE